MGFDTIEINLVVFTGWSFVKYYWGSWRGLGGVGRGREGSKQECVQSTPSIHTQFISEVDRGKDLDFRIKMTSYPHSHILLERIWIKLLTSKDFVMVDIEYTRLRSEVFSLESLWIWFDRFMVLTIVEPWSNYKISASHALKLFKFESVYLKKKNCGSEKNCGSQKKWSKKISVQKKILVKKTCAEKETFGVSRTNGTMRVGIC